MLGITITYKIVHSTTIFMLQVRRVGENHGGAVHTVLLRSAVLRAQRDSVDPPGAVAAQAPAKRQVFRGQQDDVVLWRGRDHHRRQHHVYGHRGHCGHRYVRGREKAARTRIQPTGETHGRSVLRDESHHDTGNR